MSKQPYTWLTCHKCCDTLVPADFGDTACSGCGALYTHEHECGEENCEDYLVPREITEVMS